MRRFLLFSMCCACLPVAAQIAAVDNRVQESVTFRRMPSGPSVYGIFEGRSPCAEMAPQFGAALPANCDHLKWQLILFQDPASRTPAGFSLTTEAFGRTPLTGSWTA